MEASLKSCILLLEEIMYGSKKINRAEFRKKLLAQDPELPSSNSSITRVIKSIEKDFRIFLKLVGGYYEIDTEYSHDDYLQRYHLIKGLAFREIIRNKIIETSVISEFISFENTTINKGIEWIDELMNAILNKNKIQIEYKKFEADTSSKYSMCPLMIKEYRNRFYVVGTIDGNEEYRSFALDRLVNITVMKARFKADITNKKIFDNTIGIVYGAPQVVKLWFDTDQGNYIKTLPLHPSQQILSDDENGLIITLFVTINYELEQVIKSHGSRVKVLSPAGLKNSIVKDLKETLKGY
jgi:hypothetical protein